jgi:hypothetical protein
MTLVAAWIRQLKGQKQLIVASDSRLSFGARWDCCPKIFPLVRNDSVLAFCGDTAYAYPILLQLSNSVRNYEKATSRELDIANLRPHFLKIIGSMCTQVTDLPRGDHGMNPADFKLLFAGYSSRQQDFKAWMYYFRRDKNTFDYRPLSFHRKKTRGTKPFLFMGDNVREASELLYKKLGEREKLVTGGLDMEPLEVLLEMSESDIFESIGGPPQLVKVYPYANVLPINVLWPRENPRFIAHFGRPLLSYEGSRYGCIDLNGDLNELLAPYEATARINASGDTPPAVQGGM